MLVPPIGRIGAPVDEGSQRIPQITDTPVVLDHAINCCIIQSMLRRIVHDRNGSINPHAQNILSERSRQKLLLSWIAPVGDDIIACRINPAQDCAGI